MELTTFKIISALVIFGVGLLGAWLPIRLVKHSHRPIILGNLFADGIFIGLTLFHMLPTSFKSFETSLELNPLMMTGLIFIGTFVFLILTESSLVFSKKRLSTSSKLLSSILLVFLLSFHSIVAGVALGLNITLTGAIMIFVAIIVHKGCAGFALTCVLQRTELPTRSIKSVISLFALMTPIGILLATLLTHLSSSQAAETLTASFDAIAAGTFFYIGGRDMIYAPAKYFNHGWRLIVPLIGIVLMGILSLWV